MEKDGTYSLIILLLIAVIIYFAKTGAIKEDEYDSYKKESEKRIAIEHEIGLAAKFSKDSVLELMKNRANIIEKKEVNLEIVYVEGKKEYNRVVGLDTNAAIRYMSDRFYQADSTSR